MTSEELKTIMMSQNLSVMDLATISGVTKRQAIAWRSGTSPIPRTVAFLLSALEEGELSQDWLVNTLQKELRENIDA